MAPLIQELLQEQKITLAQCDAIAVSAGPGSYTGLRVGVSTAKGLSFGSNTPIIAVNSLFIMAQNCIDLIQTDSEKYPRLSRETIIVPLMDARRMEVYTAQYSIDGEELSPVQAKIIDVESFSNELANGTVIFTGDGAEKCRSVLTHPNAHFIPLSPSADGMRKAAYHAWQKKNFEDLAYFEPYYLKDFVTGRALPTLHPTVL